MKLEFTPDGLLLAYEHGIFPMADECTHEVEWYLPDPRAIIPLDGFHLSRSLSRTMRRSAFEIRLDSDFEGVMRACSNRSEGSWISEDFIRVYSQLFSRGFAHSVEVWKNGDLVGGLYGISLGGAFMGESMFHRETDASKVAAYCLVELLKRRGYLLLDVQFATAHLASLGAVEIPHTLYSCLLRSALSRRVSLVNK